MQSCIINITYITCINAVYVLYYYEHTYNTLIMPQSTILYCILIKYVSLSIIMLVVTWEDNEIHTH